MFTKKCLIYLKYNAAVLKVIYIELLLFENKSQIFGEMNEI